MIEKPDMPATTTAPSPAQRAAKASAGASADTTTRLLNYDLAQPLAFAALAIVYALSRAPFINVGYGTDPDAWRVALSGYWLWDHAEFYPSRLPGYPVQELASAAVIKGGWLATNSLTVLVSIVGLWFFARIASLLELPNRAVIVVAFAFTPLLWINSMTTMDYMYALTFILAAYYFLIVRRSFVAGIMLGLAIGSRSTSVFMLLPLVVYMWRDGRRNEIRAFIVTAVAVSFVAWLPIYWKYGIEFFNFYDSKVGYLNVLRLLGKDTLGLLGTMAVIAAIVISLPRLVHLPANALRDKHVDVWLLAIVVTIVSFSRLPHEAAYLIPVYPFGFFLMARYFQKWVLAGTVAVIIVAGFVDLTSPGDEINSEAFTNAQFGNGLILSNRDTQLAQRDFVRDIEALDIPDNTAVSLGFIYPQFAVRNRESLDIGLLEKDASSISQLSDKGKADDDERRITYVWLFDYEDFQRYKVQGYTFMFTLDAGRSTAGLYDYRPGLFGAKAIDLGRGPSGGAGAARTDR